MTPATWKIWIDTGGTFTDCIAVTPDQQVKRLKILSSSMLRLKVSAVAKTTLQVALPFASSSDLFKGMTVVCQEQRRQILAFDAGSNTLTINKGFQGHPDVVEITSDEEVPVFAARILTATPLEKSFPAMEVKLGSTRGTNAILERKGARTVLLITKGFKDLLKIGTQQRDDLFTLNVIKRLPIYHDVIEVDERVVSTGSIDVPLTRDAERVIISKLTRMRAQSVAIALLNSYKNGAHELRLQALLQRHGYQYVSLSHTLSAQIKILQRAETAVVNAYVDPVIRQYLGSIGNSLKGSTLKVMSSAGGLLSINDFQAKDSLLSGPAGGVIGALAKAKRSGVSRIITFDMGGTSTDVSRCDDRPDYRFDCAVGNIRIFSPSLAIETIAAGGGSICDFDDFKLTVGPHSAGANPGPAAYGKGGPLTITDCNLLLGRIDPEGFSIPLHEDQAIQKADTITKRMGKSASRDQVLQSLIDIANEKMSEAIRKVSVQHGHDPSEYALLCFGGAGGQHACALATLLGIKRIIIPYEAGLLSAFGIGHAQPERIGERLVLKDLRDIVEDLQSIFDGLYQQTSIELINANPASDATLKSKLIFLRLRGQETSIEVPVTSIERIRPDFIERYTKIYGHFLDNREIEVESVRVIVTHRTVPVLSSAPVSEPFKATTADRIDIYDSGRWKSCPLFRWENLDAGAGFDGPALLTSQNSTVYIEAGWRFSLDEHQNASLIRLTEADVTSVRPAAANFELFTNRFTSLVEEMGTLLQRTSFSVNVKERLDFSCALLDAKGNLVVNAPHIPVHLGSLGVCVRSVARMIAMEDGDVVITNHPGFGGSHLPDITLIKPVFVDGQLSCYVVNRAHHSEIGGKKPGSMPADATRLTEEGVVIAPTYLIRRGVAQWDTIRHMLSMAAYPTRALEENIADLNAGLAALVLGEQSFKSLCHKFSSADVQLYMRRMREHASRLMKRCIGNLKARYTARELLDDGSVINVVIEKQKARLLIDFKGSSAVHPGNLNATLAIVNSVILYVMRLLADEPLPLNEGLLQSVNINVPPGFLNPKFPKDDRQSPAVVGGNTEVSQRVTDTLLKAFGLAACSQGTMNNLLFGDDTFGYYETICGGTGAGPGFHGSDAVHQHMTNTRITDPEVLEARYPVMLERFEIRRGSGGKGRWHGGNGVVRVLRFLKDLELNVLTQHRINKPYGMRGGEPGASGEQYLVRDEKKIRLRGVDGASLFAGDRIVMKTPGGGGWGKQK